jgi:AcrR family transcriptional regulator
MAKRRTLSEARRAQILEAAVEVIGKRGLCDTRISDIAERADASPALVVYYFETKERLLAEALTFSETRFYRETARELETMQSPTDKLVRLIELCCSENGGGQDWLDEWILWLDLWTRAYRDPGVAAEREALDRTWRETIAAIIREGQSAREFDRGVDADDLALRLASLIDGLAIQVVLKDPEVTAQRMLEICLKMVSNELKFRPARRRRPAPRGRREPKAHAR